MKEQLVFFFDSLIAVSASFFAVISVCMAKNCSTAPLSFKMGCPFISIQYSWPCLE
jgi:hypothetical protein